MVHTLMTQVHLQFECLELVGQASPGLGAHLLVGPLLEAVEFLGNVHDCGGVREESRMTRWGCGGW